MSWQPCLAQPLRLLVLPYHHPLPAPDKYWKPGITRCKVDVIPYLVLDKGYPTFPGAQQRQKTDSSNIGR